MAQNDPASAASQPILLRGARVIDPSQGLDAPGEVLIQGERIVASGPLGAASSVDETRVIDLPPGWVIAPGFVDLHTHLREPGFEAKETIQTGAQAAARGGFTTICCMPNTQPVIDDRGVVEWVKALAQSAPARVLPIAAITRGQEGAALTEMQELAEAGAVAFSD